MSRRHFINNAPTTTTTGSLTSGSTSVTVTSASGFPASFPFRAVIDGGTASAELVDVTAAVGATFTITRGADGTAAQSHGSGATFAHVASAGDYDEANAHVNSSTGVHGVAGALVGTTDVQTLSGKTLSSPVLNTPTINTPTFTGLTAPIVRFYTSGATWTKPAGLVAAFVQVQAGGGGSGAATGAGTGRSAAGGGGGGEYRQGWYAASALSATETVTVGAGGGNGTISGGHGGLAGGNSSFGAHVTANGGSGAANGANFTSDGGSSGGNGGTGGSGGDLAVPGADGLDGFVINGTTPLPGSGGGSFFSGVRSGPIFANVGNDGRTYGGGASGGAASTSNNAGGSGAAGCVIVTEFYGA